MQNLHIKQIMPFEEEEVRMELKSVVEDMVFLNKKIGSRDDLDLYEITNGLREVAWGVKTLCELILGPQED